MSATIALDKVQLVFSISHKVIGSEYAYVPMHMLVYSWHIHYC